VLALPVYGTPDGSVPPMTVLVTVLSAPVGKYVATRSRSRVPLASLAVTSFALKMCEPKRLGS
jgi:hypothetical protein